MIPHLHNIVDEFLPFVSTRLKAKLSLDHTPDGDLILTYEEHNADGSYGEPISWHFKESNG